MLGVVVKKSRNAFTMIELIFTIIIIAILAVVAIPKFATMRNDAKTSEVVQNIMIGAVEITSYAVANGKTEDDLTLMSDAMQSLSNSGEATLTNKKAVISVGGISDCLTLEIVTDTNDDNLTITLGSANGDSKCLSVQSLIDAARYPIRLRGSVVKH